LKANINGPPDLYVKSGSDINLLCKISQGPHELGNIFWYKGNEIVDMVGHENEIYSKTTQRITEDTDWADGLISRWVWHKNPNYILFSYPPVLRK
ncbi:hypothetical protein HA402_004471, partial [Bradysia odoriphaga]